MTGAMLRIRGPVVRVYGDRHASVLKSPFIMVSCISALSFELL